MPTEKNLQDFFIKRCRQQGGLAYKMVCIGRRGFPDVLVIDTRGRTHYIEMKSPSGRGRLSVHQTKLLDEMRRQGANVHIIATRAEAEVFIGSLGGSVQRHNEAL